MSPMTGNSHPRRAPITALVPLVVMEMSTAVMKEKNVLNLLRSNHIENKMCKANFLLVFNQTFTHIPNKCFRHFLCVKGKPSEFPLFIFLFDIYKNRTIFPEHWQEHSAIIL